MHISMFAVGVVDCVVVVALVVAQPAAVARSRRSFNLNWDLQEAGSLGHNWDLQEAGVVFFH